MLAEVILSQEVKIERWGILPYGTLVKIKNSEDICIIGYNSLMSLTDPNDTWTISDDNSHEEGDMEYRKKHSFEVEVLPIGTKIILEQTAEND